MAVVKNLLVRGGADFSNMYKEMKKANTQMASFKSGMSKAMKGIGAVLAVRQIGMFVKDSVKAAMDVQSSMFMLSKTMGANADDFQRWAKTQAGAFGLAQQEALSYGRTYSNLISAFEKDTGTVTSRTEELLKGTSIIASLTGRSMDDVMMRIRSGLMGETEAIEDLGVFTQISFLETTEAFKKYANGKSWKQLDYNTQQQIRLQGILEQINARFGDTLENTVGARQIQFVAQLKDIKLYLGQAFLPIYNAVLPALTAMASSIKNVTLVFAEFMQALFGFKMAKSSASATEQQAGAVSDLGDAYEEAGEAAKNSLLSFDQINLMSSPKASGGDTGGNATAKTETETDEESPTIDTSAMEAAVAKFKSLFNFENIITAWNNLKSAVAPLGETIGAGLKWLLDNVLIPFGQWTVNDAVPAFLNAIKGVLDFLNPALVALQPLGMWLWDNFLKPLGEWTGGVVVGALDAIGDALSKVGDWISKNEDDFRTMTTVVAGFFGAWKIIELLNFIQTSGGVIAVLGNIAKAIDVATLAKVRNTIAIAQNGLGYAQTLYYAIVSFTMKLWASVTAWAASTAAIVVNTAKSVIATSKLWLFNTAQSALNVVVGIGTAVMKGLSVAMAFLAANPIILVIAAVAALVAGFIYLWNTSEKFRNFFIGMWDDIKNGFKSAVNWMIDGLNKLIKGLNKLKIDFPKWIPGIGGKTFGLDIPEIPKLANGGIVSDPTLAMIGEAGKEAVVPLENSGFLDNLTSTIAKSISGSNSDQPINIYIDGVLDRSVANAKRKNSRAGRVVIPIGV